jgi:hypothetical protein
MLAYVLWHHPRGEDSTRIIYEASLLALHEGLHEAKIDGFVDSTTSTVLGLPWLPGADNREDWYVVRDWYGIGALSEALHSGRQKVARDLVTHSSSVDGAAIYRLHSGECRIDAPSAVWFPKPDGMAYWVMEELMEPLFGTHGWGLWQRQLALGPSPEFCFLGEQPWRHEAIDALQVKRTKLVSRGPSLLH